MRLRDARFYSGWVANHCGCELVVHGKGFETLEPGEEVFFEVYTGRGAARFHARLSLKVLRPSGEGPRESQALFQITNQPCLVDTPQEPRAAVSGYSVVIRSASVHAVGQLVDMSRHGLGALVDAEIPSGEAVTVTVSSTRELVSLEGQVRNCRPVEDGSGFRMGVLIELRDRIQSHRWLSLLGEVA